MNLIASKNVPRQSLVAYNYIKSIKTVAQVLHTCMSLPFLLNKAKWFAVRKPSTGEIIAMHISQSDCPAEIPWTYKNVVLHQTPLSSCSVEGGSGDETSLLYVS